MIKDFIEKVAQSKNINLILQDGSAPDLQGTFFSLDKDGIAYVESTGCIRVGGLRDNYRIMIPVEDLEIAESNDYFGTAQEWTITTGGNTTATFVLQ